MAKDVPFDPCRQWLGIDAVDLGNARLVLGVTPEESDPLVVLRAADARLNLLRAISPGPFELARTSLIKRVEETREKVLAEIAASPRPAPGVAGGFAMPAPPSHLAAATPQVPVMPSAGLPPAVPPAVPVVPPMVPGGGWSQAAGQAAGDGNGFGHVAIRTTVYRKKTPVAGTALALLALASLAGGLAYYVITKEKAQHSRAARSNDRLTARADPPANVGATESVAQRRAEPAAGRKHGGMTRKDRREDEPPPDPLSDRAISTGKPRSQEKERRPPPQPDPQPEAESEAVAAPPEAMEPPPPPKKTALNPPQAPQQKPQKPEEESPAKENPVKETPEQARQLDDTLAEVLEAMQQQEDDTVKRRLAEAFEQAGGRNFGNAASQRIDSWQQLATYYKGFLEFREKALAAVKAGNEYEVKNKKIAVVEIDDTVFKYRVAGETKRTDRDKIPGGIVLAILMEWFDANPANDLYVGAYHLAKAESAPELAREHWEKAEAGGADASALMPLLDDPVFARAMAEK
jgi:outer membrane biosynthesis protein TonB